MQGAIKGFFYDLWKKMDQSFAISLIPLKMKKGLSPNIRYNRITPSFVSIKRYCVGVKSYVIKQQKQLTPISIYFHTLNYSKIYFLQYLLCKYFSTIYC